MHNERAVISGEGKSLRRIITFITSSNCPVEVCIDHSGQALAKGRKKTANREKCNDCNVYFSQLLVLKICILKYSDVVTTLFPK